jgi:hypothetical protein
MRLASFILLLTAVGCTAGTNEKSAYEHALMINGCEGKLFKFGRDPEKDAATALAKGDQRFLGVFGFTSMISTREIAQLNYHPKFQEIVAQSGVRMIEGTSDSFGNDDACFQNMAAIYAQIYNETVIAAASEIGTTKRSPDE